MTPRTLQLCRRLYHEAVVCSPTSDLTVKAGALVTLTRALLDEAERAGAAERHQRLLLWERAELRLDELGIDGSAGASPSRGEPSQNEKAPPQVVPVVSHDGGRRPAAGLLFNVH